MVSSLYCGRVLARNNIRVAPRFSGKSLFPADRKATPWIFFDEL